MMRERRLETPTSSLWLCHICNAIYYPCGTHSPGGQGIPALSRFRNGIFHPITTVRLAAVLVPLIQSGHDKTDHNEAGITLQTPLPCDQRKTLRGLMAARTKTMRATCFKHYPVCPLPPPSTTISPS